MSTLTPPADAHLAVADSIEAKKRIRADQRCRSPTAREGEPEDAGSGPVTPPAAQTRRSRFHAGGTLRRARAANSNKQPDGAVHQRLRGTGQGHSPCNAVPCRRRGKKRAQVTVVAAGTDAPRSSRMTRGLRGHGRDLIDIHPSRPRPTGHRYPRALPLCEGNGLLPQTRHNARHFLAKRRSGMETDYGQCPLRGRGSTQARTRCRVNRVCVLVAIVARPMSTGLRHRPAPCSGPRPRSHWVRG